MKAKTERKKQTPTQRRKAKRQANLRCAEKNPAKYGRRTVKTNWLLDQLNTQATTLETEKAAASTHKKTQINAQLKVVNNLRDNILNNIVG
jgi:hypothetical protein